jgi:steroid delta-isomerase-like uncharacterized protein
MGASDNLEVHGRWSAAENNHDLSHLADFLHSDIEQHLSASEVVAGLDAYRLQLEGLFRGLPDFHTVFDDRFATDDRVVCRWTSSGTHEGEFFGLPPTGNRIEWMGISLWEFEAGKARRGWVMQDSAALMRQLGV